ncbi:MAG: hypothetical protein IPJ65_14315 [Archangiaceae bacterium]|nr:hypothetical protein [Archangiaceae bacterium]
MIPPRARLPLLGLGAVGLWWGIWLGLSRMGAVPASAPRAVADHGPLMVSGFLGTVIALERAVASGRAWAYLGPLACAASIVLELSGNSAASAWAQLGGSAVVVAVLIGVLAREAALHHAALVAAATCWLGGNAVLAAGRPVFQAVPFWLAFLVGTICAERLELTRLLPRTKGVRAAFVVAGAALAVGAAGSLADRDAGLRLLGAGQLAFAAWLWRYDLALRTVREAGQTRFIAVCLLSGYVWLGIGGALALVFGHPVAGPAYDALLHATLVGFVFSMIFGHALVIVPALLGVRVGFSRRFYVHLALLHVSLALRLAGDLGSAGPLRAAGGWLNALAIAVFMLSTAAAVRRAAPGARPASPPAPRRERTAAARAG